MTALTFKYAYRHVRAGFGRLILSIIAIALGVSLVVAFQLMNAAVLQSFLDTIDAMAGRAQLMVSAGEGLSFSEDMLDKVKGVPGVKLAVPLVRATTFPDDGSGEMLTVQGVDLANESAIRVYHDADKPAGSPNGVIDDMVEFLNSPDSIILGKEFADKRGLKKGDKLPLITPNGVQTFTIKGLLEAQGLAQTLRGRLVVMDLFAAERAFTADRQINQIDIVGEADSDLLDTRKSIANAIGSGFQVEEPAIRKGVIRNALSGFQAMVSAFSLLAIIVGFVMCYSRLRTVFESRTWETGLLRSVGVTQRSAFWEFIKESMLIGVAGTALGLVFGSVVGSVALPFFATTTAIAFRMPPPATQAVVSQFAMALGVAVGVGASIAAAIAPAYRVSRMRPIAALRMRGRELAIGRGASSYLPAVALFCLVGVLLIAQRLTGRSDLGHLVTLVLALGFLALSTPLVRFGGHALVPIWQAVFGPVGLLAGKQLSRRARRASLTVAVLGLGLGIVLLLAILEWSFERSLIESATKRIRADLVITSSRLGAGEWGGSPLSEALLDSLSHIPGVAAVAGESSREVAFRDGTTVFTAFDALMLGDDRIYRLTLEPNAVPDARALLLRGEGLFVSRAFHIKHRVDVGDYIELSSPHGPKKWAVLAISDAPFEAAVVVDRHQYNQLWNDSTVSFIYVALESPAVQAAVEAAIGREFGATHRLQIHSANDLIDYFAGQVRQAFAVQYLVALAILLLVSLSVSDALASSVVEATREYGMLRAIGVPQQSISRAVILEGGVIGVLGLFLALVTGITLGLYWVRVEFPAILGWAFEFHFPVRFALVSFSIAMCMCLIGSVLPSIRTSRLNVSAALRSE